MPRSVFSCLVCPLCKNTLSNPVSLHCGHSLCQNHLTSSACPVPQCIQPTNPPHLNLPPSSNVAYYPAPQQQQQQQQQQQPALSSPPSSTDISLSRILSLVHSTLSQLDNNDDNDDNHNPRPRKRRRYSQQDSPDLLNLLRSQSQRQRSTPHDVPLLPPPSPSSILARFNKDLLAQLTCEICFTLYYDPITTPCQHTFCSRCLHRSLDHSPNCPLCRQKLPAFLYFQDHPPNKVILAILLKVFPIPYQERAQAIEAEERDARLDTPIFICQLSFPGMPTLLHFFEPRYRLMLRRCLESPDPCFGMVMPPKPGALSPHFEYGTMLAIKSVQMQTDGRSLVETWGTYRFRILERGTLDGYMVGRIERIDDDLEDITSDDDDPEQVHIVPPPPPPDPTSSPSSPPSPAPSRSHSHTPPSHAPSRPLTPPSPANTSTPLHPSNSALMSRCRAFLDQLQRGTAPWIVQRLSSAYGTMPTDPSMFSFWVAYILPIDDYEKAKLLPIKSPRLRLLLVVHWIEQLNNNWYTISRFLRFIRSVLVLIGFFVLFFASSAHAFMAAPFESVQVVLEWVWHPIAGHQ